MACTMGGPTETKGEEKMKYNGGSVYELWSAIEQLWNWVGEQKDIQEKRIDDKAFSESTVKALSARLAYSNVRLYMRKFFSGLIDFDDEGETDGN